AALAFSAITSSQIWWDFRLYYLVPLILYSALRSFEEASAVYLFLTTVFGAATLLGNLSYFPPFILFVLVVSGGAYVAVLRSEATGRAVRFARQLTWRHVLAVAVPLLLAVATGLYLFHGTDQIAYADPGRNTAGQTASLEIFLTYGGNITVWKYVE